MQIAILKYVVVILLKFTEFNFDFYCSVGFSGVLFALYYIDCNFKNVSNITIRFFGLLPIKSKYAPVTYLLLVQMLNPNSSFLGHLSGIFTGFLLKNIFVYFTFPRKDWIKAFEDKFNYLDMTNNFRYFKISQILSEDELKEIDVGIYQLCCYRIIKRIRDRNNYSNNISTNEDNPRIINNVLSRSEMNTV